MRTAIAKLVTQDPQPISAACGITYLPSVVIGNFGLQLRSLPNEQQNASFRGHGVGQNRILRTIAAGGLSSGSRSSHSYMPIFEPSMLKDHGIKH